MGRVEECGWTGMAIMLEKGKKSAIMKLNARCRKEEDGEISGVVVR